MTEGFAEAGWDTIFTQLTMTTGSTDPGANPAHPALPTNPAPANPATIETAKREKTMILGADTGWLEGNDLLGDLSKDHVAILDAVVQIQHARIMRFLRNPEGY